MFYVTGDRHSCQLSVLQANQSNGLPTYWLIGHQTGFSSGLLTGWQTSFSTITMQQTAAS
jgi:hypothetical protein